MSKPKDCWDKAEVLGKIVVPIAVGLLLLAWNNQRTTQQTSAAMTEIAIGVLSEEPAEDGGDALRDWAIAVLQSPDDPPRLSDEAAMELRFDRVLSGSWGGDGFGGGGGDGVYGGGLSEETLREILEQPAAPGR